MKFFSFLLYFFLSLYDQIIKIDDFFIRKIFQPISDWFQLRIRRTNFFLAEIILVIELSIMISDLMSGLAGLRESFLLKNFRAWEISLFIIFFLTLIVYAHKKEKEYQETMEVKFKINNLFDSMVKEKIPIVRIILLLFFLPSFITLLLDFSSLLKIFNNNSMLVWSLFLLLYTPGFYFIGCTPLPPNKVKEWQEDKKAKLVKVTVTP